MKRPLILTLASLGACVTQQGDHSLIGRDLDFVRIRLGPPVACSYGGGTWTLAYPDAKGAVIEDAITLVDRVVIASTPRLRRHRPDAAGRWTGARIEQVVATLGEGSVESRSIDGRTIRFDDLELEVADGRVLGPAR